MYVAKIHKEERGEAMSDLDSIYTVLLEEYVSMGATGESAIEAMVDDLDNNRFQVMAEDWDVDMSVCIDIINALKNDIKASCIDEVCDGSNVKRLHATVRYERNLRETK